MSQKQKATKQDSTKPTVFYEEVENEGIAGIEEEDVDGSGYQLPEGEEEEYTFPPDNDKLVEPQDKAVIVQDDNRIQLAHGLVIDVNATDMEIVEGLLDMRQSYIGVPAKDPGQYVNMWLRCVGCMVVPMERHVPVIDRQTGEERDTIKRWDSVLFKLEKEDPDTGMNVIIKGGGVSAYEWAMTQAKMGNAGDWNKIREIRFFQEAIAVKRQKYNMQTGQVEDSSTTGRMYRLVSRPAR